MDYIPVFILGGLACASLRKVSNMLTARADEAPRTAAPAAARQPSNVSSAGGNVPQRISDTSVFGQQANNQRAHAERLDAWLRTFEGRGRDNDYDMVLKQMFLFRGQCTDGGVAVDEVCRDLESLIVGAEKLARRQQKATQALRALLEGKYLKLGKALDALPEAISDPQLGRDAMRVCAKAQRLSNRYFEFIVSVCLTAP